MSKLLDFARTSHEKYGRSKLTTLQVCPNQLREASPNIINFWHLQVPGYFLTTPKNVYGPSPCNLFSEVCVQFLNLGWRLRRCNRFGE